MRKTLGKEFKSPKTLVIINQMGEIVAKFNHITHIYSEFCMNNYYVHIFNGVFSISNFNINTLKLAGLKLQIGEK